MPRRDGLELDRGERLHYRGPLRKGGEIAVTEERVLVARDDELTSVPYANVSEVNHESFNWFLGLLSGALVVFGLYSAVRQNVLVGLFFAAAGVWSVHRTYRHRDRVRIHTHSRPKPVEVYPGDVDALYAELEPAIAAVRERREREREAEIDRAGE